MVPWAHLNPEPKRHLDQFNSFCTAERPYTLQRTALSPSKLPLPMGWSGPHIIPTWFLGSPESLTQTASRLVKPFCRVQYCDIPTDRQTTLLHYNGFTALFLGPPGWAGARSELLDFMVQGKINRGRHIDHPTECHSIRTNQCPPPPSPFLQAGCPSCRPTNSVKALKATSAFRLGRRC